MPFKNLSPIEIPAGSLIITLQEEFLSSPLSKIKVRAVRAFIDSRGCYVCISHKPGNSGYPRIRINKQLYCLHRYIYEKHHGPIPKGMCVCHKCDNPYCINIDHLFLGSILDNNRDMYLKGRNAKPTPEHIERLRKMVKERGPLRGSLNGNSRLTEDQVKEIRQKGRYKPLAYIAKDYGVDRKLIYLILKKEVWKHVE